MPTFEEIKREVKIHEIHLGILKKRGVGEVYGKPWKANYILQRVWQVSDNGGETLTYDERQAVIARLKEEVMLRHPEP